MLKSLRLNANIKSKSVQDGLILEKFREVPFDSPFERCLITLVHLLGVQTVVALYHFWFLHDFVDNCFLIKLGEEPVIILAYFKV